MDPASPSGRLPLLLRLHGKLPREAPCCAKRQGVLLIPGHAQEGRLWVHQLRLVLCVLLRVRHLRLLLLHLPVLQLLLVLHLQQQQLLLMLVMLLLQLLLQLE